MKLTEDQKGFLILGGFIASVAGALAIAVKRGEARLEHERQNPPFRWTDANRWDRD